MANNPTKKAAKQAKVQVKKTGSTAPAAAVAQPVVAPRQSHDPTAPNVPEPTPHYKTDPVTGKAVPTGTDYKGDPFINPFLTPTSPPVPAATNVRRPVTPRTPMSLAERKAYAQERSASVLATKAARQAATAAAHNNQPFGLGLRNEQRAVAGTLAPATPQTNITPAMRERPFAPPPTGDPQGGGVSIQPVYPPGYQPPTRDPQTGGVNTQHPLNPNPPVGDPWTTGGPTGISTPAPTGDSEGDMTGWEPPTSGATSPSTTPGAVEGSIGTALGGAGGTGGLPTNPEAVAGASAPPPPTGGSAGYGGYAPTKAPPPMPSFQQWQQMTPFERAAWRTQAEMAQPWEATTDQLRHSWANQGVFGAPDTTQLTASGYNGEQRIGANQTAEAFGRKPEDYWSDESKQWGKSSEPSVSQKTW